MPVYLSFSLEIKSLLYSYTCLSIRADFTSIIRLLIMIILYYLSVFVCVCVCVYIYIYIYTHFKKVFFIKSGKYSVLAMRTGYY